MNWTRQEAILLSGLRRSQFEVLERKGLLVGHKLGNPNKPTVMYSNAQLLTVRAYKKLLEYFSTKEMLGVLEAILDPNKATIGKRVIALNTTVDWIENTMVDLVEFLEYNRDQQLLATFTSKDLIRDIRNDYETLIKSQNDEENTQVWIWDFDRRISCF